VEEETSKHWQSRHHLHIQRHSQHDERMQ
jgi:hypothetical protein